MARAAIRGVAISIVVAVLGSAPIAYGLVTTSPVRFVLPTEDCFGENVVAIGTGRFVSTDGGDRLVQVYPGLEATGSLTGSRYVVSMGGASIVIGGDQVFTGTVTDRLVVIGPDGRRFVLHGRFHFTIIGDRPVVEFLVFRSRCVD